VVGGEVVQIIDGMLRCADEVVGVACLRRYLNRNTEWKDGSADLGIVRHARGEQRETYLAISPIRHVLQRKLCAIYGRSLPPYWQTQTGHNDPKRKDHPSPRPQALLRLRRRLFVAGSRADGLRSNWRGIWVRWDGGRRIGASWWSHLAMLLDV
jgi:hypothetical protein